jgi:hypothetical protein
MAQQEWSLWKDDLDGSPEDEAVRFGVGRADYEIDLSEENVLS